MQKYHQRQSKSPLTNNKVIRTKTQHTSKDESINIDNSIKDQTLEKLFLQLDQLRKRHEQEKKEMSDSFNQQIQIKSNQLQKSLQEFQQKNQLLESLLFQEQAKTIHLTKIIQEKQKSTGHDQEKEQYKNKIQQLEIILQDSQRKNQIIPNKFIQKDTSFKILIEIINKVSVNILHLIKEKNTNISWIDQEILEIDILKQKDLNKSLLKLNTIFDKFFVQLQEREKLSLSPYKISTKNNNQTINSEKTTIPIQKPKIKMINSETQTKEIQNKISKFQQTDKIEFKSKLTQTDFLIVENEGKIEQNFEKQKLLREPQKQQTIKEQKIIKNYRIQQQISISMQLQSSNRAQQKAKPKLISTEVQTDQIQNEQQKVAFDQNKHYSKITEQDDEENEFSKDQSKRNNSQQIEKGDNNEVDSSFDCNKPDYDSEQENDQKQLEKLKTECQQQQISIINLQLTLNQLLQQQNLFQFDNLITSEHCSLQDLIINKWSIKLKDHNATLKYSIGILSQNQTFLKNIIKSIYGVEQQIQFDLHQIAIQYYDTGFQENYRLDVILKQLEFPSQFLINSTKIQERQEFQQFWIDFMIQQCNLFIYMVKDFNENDQRVITYLQNKNKKVTIISYDLNDYIIDNFSVFNNYKYNIDYQIIKIQNNQNILQSLWRDILQSEWEWEEINESILVQLQQFICNIVENEDCIHLQIKEDGIFEISLMIDQITYDYLWKIPYVKNKEIKNNEIELFLELPENKKILEVKCIGNQILIIIDRFILLEQYDQLIQLNSINNNLILLTIIQ
ncbi:unnamed protein product [Paramecium pentaurelia]|uniref:Uncharacterized protein n=1 Tax=Paramecium pentaurelia TaxID=43138 RepID=A0A8S1SLQ8_9CILI|nr:unnamed protein product [Paramecium pentaurelia]